MNTLARWGLFAAFVAIAGMALLPLRLAGLDSAGISARAATGTVWRGRLAAARLGGVALGDIDVALQPLALLGGGLTVALAGETISGRLEKRAGGGGVSGVSGRIGPLQPGGFAVTSIDLEDVDIGFADGRCAVAAGRIAVQPAIGRTDGDRLGGSPHCDGSTVVLPLVSASGQERLDVRIDSGGSFRANLAIDGASEAERAALFVAGFRPTSTGLAMTVEGRF